MSARRGNSGTRQTGDIALENLRSAIGANTNMEQQPADLLTDPWQHRSPLNWTKAGGWLRFATKTGSSSFIAHVLRMAL
ncbi:hypothetical protein [Amycolatopsis saalfeldensis]|uniref:Uncharacterized protein n=1 Tax=Amycolatopsis saalfeldensis TaxID=394193 RepID=A0A1H8XWJ7_9PSEU|nr:hypothetical protein [Amycolatopsis saalfeldensis]SEP44414.1 hypothetical protein SAMN04489732_109230 [Amycolatopsis saalfeldensis]